MLINIEERLSKLQNLCNEKIPSRYELPFEIDNTYNMFSDQLMNEYRWIVAEINSLQNHNDKLDYLERYISEPHGNTKRIFDSLMAELLKHHDPFQYKLKTSSLKVYPDDREQYLRIEKYKNEIINAGGIIRYWNAIRNNLIHENNNRYYQSEYLLYLNELTEIYFEIVQSMNKTGIKRRRRKRHLISTIANTSQPLAIKIGWKTNIAQKYLVSIISNMKGPYISYNNLSAVMNGTEKAVFKESEGFHNAAFLFIMLTAYDFVHSVIQINTIILKCFNFEKETNDIKHRLTQERNKIKHELIKKDSKDISTNGDIDHLYENAIILESIANGDLEKYNKLHNSIFRGIKLPSIKSN